MLDLLLQETDPLLRFLKLAQDVVVGERPPDVGGEAALGTSAFSGCGSLADADLSKVATVGKRAFYNCVLTRADLSSAETIGYGAFTGNDLREVAFSPGLESVDPKAFFRYSFCGADGAKRRSPPPAW